jgi:hypothetical protein
MTYPRMDAGKRDALIAALLSGEFGQGRNGLRRPNDRYCCLGVACELYRRTTGQGEWQDGAIVDEFFLAGSRSNSFLPDDVAEYYGLHYAGSLPVEDLSPGERYALYDRFRREFPTMPCSDDFPPCLSRMNDGGFSFEEIARAIELFW